MNYIDYIIVILVVISAVRGIVKGLVYEVASLVALIGGIWGAVNFSYATETLLIERFDLQNEYIHVIAFAITLVLIVVVVHLFAKAIEKILKSVALGTVNRLLGMVFSVFKAIFFLGVLVILTEKLDESFPVIPEDDIEESKFYEPLRTAAINTFPFVQNFYEDIKTDSDNKEKEKKREKRKNRKDRKA